MRGQLKHAWQAYQQVNHENAQTNFTEDAKHLDSREAEAEILRKIVVKSGMVLNKDLTISENCLFNLQHKYDFFKNPVASNVIKKVRFL